MDSNFSDDEQFNNNTWDEYSDLIVCPSPLLLGHPKIKKFNDQDELSIIHLQYHTDTIDDGYNPLNQQQISIKKKLHKNHKKTSLKKNKSPSNLNSVLNDFVSYVNLPQDGTTQQIHYCQQMRQLIDNLEGILQTIKSQILNQYQKQKNQKN